LETRGLLVELTGPLTALDRDLEDAIVGYLNAGRRDFILKMSGVTNIDSIGLGQLISVYKLIKASDGTMRISSPSKRVGERLKATRLDTVFDIFYDETAA
jgi:anti-sigma B factor antagonist